MNERSFENAESVGLALNFQYGFAGRLPPQGAARRPSTNPAAKKSHPNSTALAAMGWRVAFFV
jgi:hypothetical protein